jgi:hypothetical protein
VGRDAAGDRAAGLRHGHHLNNLFAVILGRSGCFWARSTRRPPGAHTRSFGGPPRMARTSRVACSDSAASLRCQCRWRWT